MKILADIFTVMWKENKELFRFHGKGTRGSFLGLVVFISVFGIFLPLQMGQKWVDSPVVLLFWVWVPLFLVSSVVADSFAGERERHTLETLLASRLSDRAILIGKILASMGYGIGLTLVSLALGLVTVNIAFARGGFLFYPAIMCVGIILWIPLGAGLTACAGVLVSLKASTVRQAQQTLSIAIMLILLCPFLTYHILPDGWKQSIMLLVEDIGLPGLVYYISGLLAALDLVLLKAAMSRFRRARLILD